MANALGTTFMGTDNESSLRYVGFERLSGHPVNSRFLASGNSGPGLWREVRISEIDGGLASTSRGELRF